MENLLIEFKFDAPQVASSVGNFNASFQNATVINGPTVDGQATQALDLGTTGKGSVDLNGLSPNFKKFCLQVSFKVNDKVSSRQNVMEANFLPFALFADKGSQNDTFELIASTNLKKYGWRHADTRFKKELKLQTWYTVSIVYDFDTLGLFIDDNLISIHGFPTGTIKPGTVKKLFFGTWTDGTKFHMNGALGQFKWYDGIPSKLESLLDEQRANAEWHITYKHAAIHGKINSGKRLKGIQFNTGVGSYTQFYEHCGIMFHERAGVAFEMHGSIYAKYKAMRNKAAELGYLITDEVKATNASGRKSLFSKGGIYWHNSTGAHPVLDQIYLEYENLGESGFLGFPKRSATNVPGGQEQIFQHARMYYKTGAPKAHEVHGAILAKYIAKGGVRKWGFPVSNECDVKIGSSVKGKYSEFEGCTIYWKAGIGAFEVHGDIRKKYEQLNGPLGKLGFPTSDESDIPNFSGTGRINSFEKGCINWYGNWNSICVALPFKIRLQRIHSRESEGAFMGQNDIHFYAKIKNGSTTLHSKRYPTNGDYGGHNVINPNITFPPTITPNKINMRISYAMDIRDSDPGNDDHLGNHVTVLNAANAWGYRQPNQVFNQSFSKIKSLLWSIKPQINIASLSEKEKWWGFKNFKTPTISKDQYAAAFRDVDSETEWWDILDGLKNLYYKWVVKGVAGGGNCFGMSLEAIYARKNNSLLNQPLENVVKNTASVNEINIKHTYQVGAGPIWWFVGQFLTGNTHDPKDVFNATRNAFLRGDNPVLCVSQNYDFSGAPHCIMPYKWEKSGSTWKMYVMDPNKPGNTSLFVKVDANNNTFRYEGSKVYTGGAWSGGRMHYMPFCVLNGMVRTPVWDAIMLLLSGTILILADDAETVSITDENGKDLDGNGERAKQVLKSGASPEEYFASFVGFETGNLKPGQLMLRKDKYQSSIASAIDRVSITAMPIDFLARNRRVPGFTTRSLPSNRSFRERIGNRTAHHLLNDPEISAQITDSFKDKLKQILKSNSGRNFKHTVKGAKNGRLEYYIKSQLNSVKIDSAISNNEVNTITTKDLNTNACSIDFHSPKDKTLNLEIDNKLGVHGDHITISLQNIAVKASKTVKLNVKSGLTGIELENPGMTGDIPIRISGVIDGKKIEKRYQVPFDKAIRIKPTTMIHSDQLVVAKIPKLFGIVKDSIVINKQ